MPATAGRVRMPANNRMQTSASLNTHGIWQNAIGYDPYAGEADKAKAENGAGDGQSAYDSMKDLFALARQQGRLAADDTRGGWKGSGRLKGGWVGGKDLAEVASGSSVATLMAVAADDMPSSTSSWSDSEEVAQYRAPIATKKQSADFFAPRNGSVDSGKDGEKSKKRKHEKSKKDKKHKKHKKEKSKKEKKEKKHRRDRRSRRHSSSSYGSESS